jgi:hypothetical protein
VSIDKHSGKHKNLFERKLQQTILLLRESMEPHTMVSKHDKIEQILRAKKILCDVKDDLFHLEVDTKRPFLEIIPTFAAFQNTNYPLDKENLEKFTDSFLGVFSNKISKIIKIIEKISNSKQGASQTLSDYMNGLYALEKELEAELTNFFQSTGFQVTRMTADDVEKKSLHRFPFNQKVSQIEGRIDELEKFVNEKRNRSSEFYAIESRKYFEDAIENLKCSAVRWFSILTLLIFSLGFFVYCYRDSRPYDDWLDFFR